jgi:hypothetical protein
MKCPRCQHENAPTLTFCGECGTSLTAKPSGPPASSYADITRALSEALEQQTATSEILRVISSSPKAKEPLETAIARYREAGMGFWLEQAEPEKRDGGA